MDDNQVGLVDRGTVGTIVGATPETRNNNNIYVSISLAHLAECWKNFRRKMLAA